MLQRVWGWRCGLLQVLVVLSSAVSADRLYSLVPPDVYEVFGGDLVITYRLPANVSLPNAFVRLESRGAEGGTWREITTMGLPQGSTSGTLSAACGIVEFAGRYSLTMFMHMDGQVLTEVTFRAVWPSVVLRLPTTHYALTSSVAMEIESGATCNSKLHRQFFKLELYFQRIEESDSDFAKLSESEKISEQNFTSIDKGKHKVNYPCSVFDIDGFYQVLLRSSTGSTLNVSNVMGVTFSASYHLSVRRSSVFPCKEGSTLDVLYTNPSCSSVDRFRVYKLLESPGSLAAPMERVYVTELKTNPDRSRLELNCSLFDGTVRGYCFVYVTVARSGAAVEQRQICLSTQPGAALPQDGGWSGWTAWTACSVTCGLGKRNRFRMCNNPRTEHGGRYCPGHAVQWSHCQIHCPDALPRTPLRSPKLDPNCHCGCTRTGESGEIIASGRCQGLATWIISTTPGQQVTLTFRYYHIRYKDQWVKVRDGDQQTDDLLFFSRSESQPYDVTSSSNVMRVELMTEVVMTSPAEMTVFSQNASLPIHLHGFIASFSATDPDPAQLPKPLFRHVKTGVMQTDVTIVGLVVVAMVVAAVVVVVVVRRRYWHHLPKYSAACEDSPAHAAHSSSAQSSQPSSPGPHVQVDMDIPLTGGGKRKSSTGQRAVSRTPSITSTCSAGLKKIRSRAGSLGKEEGGGGVGAVFNGSPKPSSKDYNTLASPYTTGTSPEDPAHDANFFKASPIMKRVAPRSPKVHPHRMKSSPGTPSSPLSSAITKHEMLTRKRHERKGASTPAEELDGEREVTGSSGSGSTSRPSAASHTAAPLSPSTTTITTTTTKAEINLTKRPDSRASSSSSKLKSPSDSKPVGSATRLRSPVDSKSVKSAASSSKKRSQREVGADTEEIPLMDSVEELLPHQLVSDPQSTPTCEETSFIMPKSKARRPISLTESYSLDAIAGSKSRTPKSPAGKPSAMEERQTLLPKPDGQSPKLEREEVGEEDRVEKGSKDSSSPSKSSVGGRSHKTLSPTRSIASPELEYDDFIMDDPLSYFEYEELGRLNWTGTERIGHQRRHDNT